MNTLSSLNQYISLIGLATLVTAFGILFRINASSRNAAKDELAAELRKHAAEIKEKEVEIAHLARELKWAEKFTSEELIKKFEAYDKLINRTVLAEKYKVPNETVSSTTGMGLAASYSEVETSFQNLSIELLRSDHLESRLTAIKHLAGLRTKSSISALVECLVEDNFHVRQAAIRALFYISTDSDEDLVSRLLDVIERASHDAAHDIAKALRIFGGSKDKNRIRQFAKACSDQVISGFLMNTVDSLSK